MQIIGLMSKKDLTRIISQTLRRMDLNKAEKAISAGRQAAQEMGVNFSNQLLFIEIDKKKTKLFASR